MSILFQIVDILGVIFEILISFDFLKSVSVKKHCSKIVSVITCSVLIIFQAVVLIGIHQQVITALTLFLSILIMAHLFKLSWVKRFLFSLLLIILFILLEIITGLLLTLLSDLSVEALSQNIFYYIQGALISKVLMLVIVKAFNYYGRPSDVKIPGYLFIPLIVLPISTFLITYIMSDYIFKETSESIQNLSVFAVITMIVSNVSLFYLFEHQIKETESKNRTKLLEQQLSYKAEYYKELSEKQKISNKAMHDLKNQLFALKDTLLSKPEHGISIVTHICENLSATETVFFTGNEPIDALISAKQQLMTAKNISFKHSIHISQKSNIEPMDMCVLLGNLIDNAIEANEKIEVTERFISINMTQQENYLSIHVWNALSAPVQIENNTILSTKKQKEIHGFGLQAIREIVEKYNGTCSIKQNEKEFHAYLMLQNN